MVTKPTGTQDKLRLVGFAFELGYVIALPIVLFGLLGKYLDARWHTHPYLKLAGVALAIATTVIWLTRRFTQMRSSFTSSQNKDNSHS